MYREATNILANYIFSNILTFSATIQKNSPKINLKEILGENPINSAKYMKIICNKKIAYPNKANKDAVHSSY